MKYYLYRIVMLVITLGVFHTAHAENVYLEQIQKPSHTKPDDKLHERIKQFQNKKRYQIKNLPSFHRQTEKKQAPETLCQQCHGRLPHAENSHVRAFLNQHSQRIDCLTCHYKPDKFTLNYVWIKSQAELEKRQKIAPVVNQEPLVISAKHPFAIEIKKRWDNGDLYEKARLYQQIHQPLADKKIACRDCHQHQGLLDLQALQFKPEAINTIENNRISRFLSGLKQPDADSSADDKPRILLRGLLQ